MVATHSYANPDITTTTLDRLSATSPHLLPQSTNNPPTIPTPTIPTAPVVTPPPVDDLVVAVLLLSTVLVGNLSNPPVMVTMTE